MFGSSQGLGLFSLTLTTLIACGGVTPAEPEPQVLDPHRPVPSSDAGQITSMDASAPRPPVDAGMNYYDGGETPPDTGVLDAGSEASPDAGPPSEEAMCLESARDTCEECGCRSCLAEFSACEAEPGCPEIRDCAQKAGCAGVRCIGPCGELIREYGGAFGDAVEKLTDLGDCMNAQCPGCLPE